MTKLSEIEKEWESFLKMNCSPMVDKDIRYSPRGENGLGMLMMAIFWRSVIMSRLRRLITKKYMWKSLHREEVGNNMFDPTNSNMESLEEARGNIKNPVWRDIF